jgi:hypothetical protein
MNMVPKQDQEYPAFHPSPGKTARIKNEPSFCNLRFLGLFSLELNNSSLLFDRQQINWLQKPYPLACYNIDRLTLFKGILYNACFLTSVCANATTCMEILTRLTQELDLDTLLARILEISIEWWPGIPV